MIKFPQARQGESERLADLRIGPFLVVHCSPDMNICTIRDAANSVRRLSTHHLMKISKRPAHRARDDVDSVCDQTVSDPETCVRDLLPFRRSRRRASQPSSAAGSLAVSLVPAIAASFSFELDSAADCALSLVFPPEDP